MHVRTGLFQLPFLFVQAESCGQFLGLFLPFAEVDAVLQGCEPALPRIGGLVLAQSLEGLCLAVQQDKVVVIDRVVAQRLRVMGKGRFIQLQRFRIPMGGQQVGNDFVPAVGLCGEVCIQ